MYTSNHIYFNSLINEQSESHIITICQHHPHQPSPCTTPCTMPCTTHAPTHARPSLPVIPNPNPAPPKLYPRGLHDTAAHVKKQNFKQMKIQSAALTVTSIFYLDIRSSALHFLGVGGGRGQLGRGWSRCQWLWDPYARSCLTLVNSWIFFSTTKF